MSEVAQLEHQRESFKEQIQNRDMAIRLATHPDFKKLILQEFCVNECARYAQQSANPGLSDREQKDALAIAQAAGHLRRFLSVMIQMGNNAENQMVDLDEALAEARRDEAGHGEVEA